jgi:hypothetical protein
MAYRSLADVANQTTNLVLPGLVQKYLTANEYLAWADTIVTDRKTISINRIADYGAVQAAADCTTSLSSVAISASNETFSLLKYIRQFEICNDVVGLGSTFVDQAGEELLGAVKAMSNQLAIDAMTGNGSTGIRGLSSLVSNSVAASTVGGSGSLEAIWYLSDAVRSQSNKMAYVANAKTKRRILKLIANSAQVQTVELKGSSFLVPVFNSYPILRNDSVADGEIYLVNGDPQEGVFMAIGEYPGQEIGGVFKYTDVGINQTYDTRIGRIAGHFAHIIKSPDSLAKVTSW